MKKETITSEFTEKVKEVFADDLEFAFLCGSYVREGLRPEQDIDMFLCVKNRDKVKEKIFLDWYFYLHKKYKCIPDKKYKYEITTELNLLKSINVVQGETPDTQIKKKIVFDGIVWMCMLISKKKGFIGNSKKCKKLQEKALKLANNWKNIIKKNISNLEPDHFLTKVIKYE